MPVNSKHAVHKAQFGGHGGGRGGRFGRGGGHQGGTRGIEKPDLASNLTSKWFKNGVPNNLDPKGTCAICGLKVFSFHPSCSKEKMDGQNEYLHKMCLNKTRQLRKSLEALSGEIKGSNPDEDVIELLYSDEPGRGC